MAGFTAAEVAHLARMKPLTKPLLLDIRDCPQTDLTPGQSKVLGDISFLQRKYQAIPYGAANVLRKVFAYRGRNPIVVVASNFLERILMAHARLYGRSVSRSSISKGLGYARETRKLMAAIAAPAMDAVSYESGVGYSSESNDLAIAQRYQAWHKAGMHFATDEERLGTTFHFAIESVDRLLKESPHITSLINFGACYGVVEYEVARRNPSVKVCGVDRAPVVKKFNDELFKAPNLEYIAADIQKVLGDHGDLSSTAFLFMRTAMIFPESYMDELFSLLKTKQIGAVIGLEPYGYSLTENRFYVPSIEYQPSIHYRSSMLMHNYPNFCARAGLKLIEQKYLVRPESQNNEDDLSWLYFFAATR